MARQTRRKGARKDVHATITQNIIEAIEKGQATNELPWRRDHLLPIRFSVGRPYRGVNVLNLWAESMLRGFSSPYWAGFGTWKNQGGSVKGQTGSIVVYSGTKERESKDGELETVRYLRYFTVFNRDQVSGLTVGESAETENSSAVDGDAGKVVEHLCKRHNVLVIVHGDAAFYTPVTDSITMPDKARFSDTAEGDADTGYATTLAHELVHATAHSSRCERSVGSWGTPEYAREELVAELGSAFVCARLGIGYHGVSGHAGYVEGWLTELRSDPTALFKASKLASDACDYLVSDNPEDVDAEDANVSLNATAVPM